MKKSRRRLIFHALFWLLIAAGALWVAYAPRPPHRAPGTAHVVVEQMLEETESPPVGDEKSQAPEPALPSPVPLKHSRPPQIAIVIDDVGLDMKGSRRAIALPSYVTLSFMPYATRLREQTRDARDNGHELMLHMPMEPIGRDDPGPGALLTSLSPDEIRQRLEAALSSFVSFDGMNNHMGSKFTADRDDMEIVIGELQQRHLFFLDSRTSAKSVAEKVALEHGLPTIGRDIFLDDVITPDAIRTQLDQAERVARRKGYAVAIGHPHGATMDVLEQWLPEAEARGVRFVPVKALINPKSAPN